MSVDVKQQIRIRGAHRAYVSKLLKRVPEVAPDDEEQIELLRISLKETFSIGRLGQVYFGARRGRQD